MAEMKQFKKTKTLLAAFISAALIVMIPSTAFASGSTGGSGGGSNAGAITSGIHWSVAAGTKGTAYREFIKASKGTGSQTWIEGEMRRRNINVNVCKNATVIWWVRSSNKWVYNFTGATHGPSKTSTVKGTLENPSTVIGRRASSQETNAIKAWDKNSNGNKLDKRPGYTMLCSFNDPADIISKTGKVESSTTSANDVFTAKEIYSYSSAVTALRTIGGTWQAEPTKVTKTNFGTLHDSLATGKNGLTTAQLRTQVEKAVKDGNARTYNNDVTLKAANQTLFAKGGILDINEFTQYATVNSTTTTKTTRSRPCETTVTQKWDQSKGVYGPKTSSTKCEPYKNSVTVERNVTKTIHTAENTGFWQMIAVHCNMDGFNNLIKSGNGVTLINSGDASKKISAVAQTKKYDKKPTIRDFGDVNNTNAAKKATANIGFFDKECPFDCTADPQTANGASVANGATKNVPTTKMANTRRGVVSSGVNQTKFEFFRDNDGKRVDLAVWYPKTAGVVDYKSTSKAPISTTISRWDKGTPSTQGNGAKFTMTAIPETNKNTNGTIKDASKNVKLFQGNGTVATQKNWDTTAFSNANSTQFAGFARSFDVQASWASEKDLPQVVNVKWEYDAPVSISFPTTVGFSKVGVAKTGTGGTARSSNAKAVFSDIQGKCVALFGETASRDNTYDFYTNTGTGTTNGLDGKLLEGTAGNSPETVASNVVFNFLRSTTE